MLLLSSNLLFAQKTVVLIIADDLGSDYCGFYEDHADTVKLPGIRRLLPNAVRFRNAWSNPLCSPTRAGIITGRHSFRTGVGDVVVSGVPALDTSEITIPKLLRAWSQDQIKCANLGKWHLSPPGPASFSLPNKMGYNHYEGSISGALPSYFTWNKVRNGQASQVNRYATTENTDNAIEWLKAQGSSPVFLWLAYNAPHSPFHLPPANLHSYDTLSGTSSAIAANPRLYFKAMVEAMDHEIGRLFDSLTTMQRWDSTSIIFIGDNGDDPLVAQNAGTGGNSKGGIYQNGVSVPFLIAGPSIIQGGRSSDALVSTHDLFATILELAGNTSWHSQIPDSVVIDSRSLVPILKNQSDSIRQWAFTEVFRPTPLASDGKAMRSKKYKLLDFDNGSQKFFHLPDDPGENNNLLLQPLSPEAQVEYEFLCGQMAALTQQNRFCDISTAVSEFLPSATEKPFPNPFSDCINLPEEYLPGWFSLRDCFGRQLFSGKASNWNPALAKTLSPGIYLMELMGSAGRTTFRLLKNTDKVP